MSWLGEPRLAVERGQLRRGARDLVEGSPCSIRATNSADVSERAAGARRRRRSPRAAASRPRSPLRGVPPSTASSCAAPSAASRPPAARAERVEQPRRPRRPRASAQVPPDPQQPGAAGAPAADDEGGEPGQDDDRIQDRSIVDVSCGLGLPRPAGAVLDPRQRRGRATGPVGVADAWWPTRASAPARRWRRSRPAPPRPGRSAPPARARPRSVTGSIDAVPGPRRDRDRTHEPASPRSEEAGLACVRIPGQRTGLNGSVPLTSCRPEMPEFAWA